MDLASLAKQVNRPVDGQTILIHGDPGTGKTRLAATIAKCPHITKVHYFGLDNGGETLFTMFREGALTEEEATKIQMYKVLDIPSLPYAYETIFKVVGTRAAIDICLEHGRAMQNCKICTAAKAESQTYDIREQNKNTATIIDTGSQLADSHMHYLCRDKPEDFKPGWEEYGPNGLKMGEILSVMQAGMTNWVFVTQSIGINIVIGTVDQIALPVNKKDPNSGQPFIEKAFPLCGSQANSVKVGKYFGQKIYTKTNNLGKYIAGSSIDFHKQCVIGSRTGWKIEKEETLSLHHLWDRIHQDRQVKK